MAGRLRGGFRGRKVERGQPASAIRFAPESSGNLLIDFLRRLDRGLKSPAPPPADDSSGEGEQTPPAADVDEGVGAGGGRKREFAEPQATSQRGSRVVRGNGDGDGGERVTVLG